MAMFSSRASSGLLQALMDDPQLAVRGFEKLHSVPPAKLIRSGWPKWVPQVAAAP